MFDHYDLFFYFEETFVLYLWITIVDSLSLTCCKRFLATDMSTPFSKLGPCHDPIAPSALDTFIFKFPNI